MTHLSSRLIFRLLSCIVKKIPNYPLTWQLQLPVNGGLQNTVSALCLVHISSRSECQSSQGLYHLNLRLPPFLPHSFLSYHLLFSSLPHIITPLADPHSFYRGKSYFVLISVEITRVVNISQMGKISHVCRR